MPVDLYLPPKPPLLVPARPAIIRASQLPQSPAVVRGIRTKPPLALGLGGSFAAQLMGGPKLPVEIAGTATAIGSTSGSVFTTGALAIGDAHGRRHVVAAVQYRLNVDPTGCTIGGISAGAPIHTAREVGQTPDMGVALFWVAVPTGTTAVAEVTFPSGDGEMGITLLRMLNATSVSDFDGATNTSGVLSMSTVTIPTGGVGVWSGAGYVDPNQLTWTGATRYSNYDIGTYQGSAAESSTPGTPTVTLTQTSSIGLAMVGAAFV